MAHDLTDLPLFIWQPSKPNLIAFPLGRRVGKIRDVASKMLEKTTERHANFYRAQIDEALEKQLKKIGLCEAAIQQQTDEFWRKVQQEMARQSYAGLNSPKGAA